MRRRWTQPECVAALHAAIAETDEARTRRGYERWHARQPNPDSYPTSKTIEKTLTRWSNAVSAADSHVPLMAKAPVETASRAHAVSLGEALTEIAQENGVSARKIAAAFPWRTNMNTIAKRWLNGAVPVPVSAGPVLCTALGTTPAEVRQRLGGGPTLTEFFAEKWNKPALTNAELGHELRRRGVGRMSYQFRLPAVTPNAINAAAVACGLDAAEIANAAAVADTFAWETATPESPDTWVRAPYQWTPPYTPSPRPAPKPPQRWPRLLHDAGSIVTVRYHGFEWPALVLRNQGFDTRDREPGVVFGPRYPHYHYDDAPTATMMAVAVQEPNGEWTPAVVDPVICSLVAPSPAPHGWCGLVPWGDPQGVTWEVGGIADSTLADIEWPDTWLLHFTCPDVAFHGERTAEGLWRVSVTGTLPHVTIAAGCILALPAFDDSARQSALATFQEMWANDPLYAEVADATKKGWQQSDAWTALHGLASIVAEFGVSAVTAWHEAGITDPWIIDYLFHEVGLEQPERLESITIWAKESPLVTEGESHSR